MKKFLMAGLLASSMVFNVACESSDVAAGVIAVGIGIGLAGIDDDDHSHRDHRDHRDRRDHRDSSFERERERERDRVRQNERDQVLQGHRDQDRRDRRDDLRDQFDSRPGRCRNGLCLSAEVASVDMTNLKGASADFASASFAEKHGIPAEAGAKIQKAFASVSRSGLASFQEIGLDGKALDKIMSRELPEAAAIKSMSQQLKLSEVKSQALLQSLVSEFQAQSSDGQSAYWQSCLAKGQWKTPQNAFCSNASWSGCSPETGATLCY